jgi:hypothetical protein
VIQFACPSCKGTCSVGDQFAKRKLKCPKCGARVLHIDGTRVELLTAGKDLPPKPAETSPSASGEATQPLTDITPVATAVLPHSVGELMSESESKQNLHIIIGLLLLFAVAAVVLGFMLNLKLLIVGPFAVVLSAAGLYLWLHTRKIQQRLESRKKPEQPKH